MFKDFNIEISHLRSVHRLVFVGFFCCFLGGYCGWDCIPDFFLSMIIIVTQKSNWVLCVDFASSSIAGSVFRFKCFGW